MQFIDLDDHIDHARERMMQDALATATGTHWRRRAEDMEWAKPRRGDFPGRATPADLRAAWRRCDERARACHNAAVVAEWPYDPEGLIAARVEEFNRGHDAQRFARATEGVAA